MKLDIFHDQRVVLVTALHRLLQFPITRPEDAEIARSLFQLLSGETKALSSRASQWHEVTPGDNVMYAGALHEVVHAQWMGPDRVEALLVPVHPWGCGELNEDLWIPLDQLVFAAIEVPSANYPTVQSKGVHLAA